MCTSFDCQHPYFRKFNGYISGTGNWQGTWKRCVSTRDTEVGATAQGPTKISACQWTTKQRGMILNFVQFSPPPIPRMHHIKSVMEMLHNEKPFKDRVPKQWNTGSEITDVPYWSILSTAIPHSLTQWTMMGSNK